MATENEEFKEPSRREFTKLNIEYQECISSSRFHVGIRFSYFVSFATFFFVLIGAFHFVWTSGAKELQHLKPVAMLAISAFGFYTVGTALFIEWRTYQIFRHADKRAAKLERMMGIKGGIRQAYARRLTPKRFLRKIPITHTRAIDMFYRATAFVWILLALFSVGFGIYTIWLIFNPLKEVCHG